MVERADPRRRLGRGRARHAAPGGDGRARRRLVVGPAAVVVRDDGPGGRARGQARSHRPRAGARVRRARAGAPAPARGNRGQGGAAPRVRPAAAWWLIVALVASAAPLPAQRRLVPSDSGPREQGAGGESGVAVLGLPAGVLREGPQEPVRETRPCEVVNVHDGDTLTCRGGTRVRLIGIDAPELSQRPYGQQARAALRSLAPVGSLVMLEADVEPRDRYGRSLAYVWRDSLQVNWVMIRAGWALQLTYPPNVQYVEQLRAGQRAARNEARGLWAERGFDCRPVDRRRGRC
ncbi:MAG: thermonuclease family protein [Gemmatimonadetes bacterium]|nr:thermonuclease family protein [Gemmatimonadota bacterium]